MKQIYIISVTALHSALSTLFHDLGPLSPSFGSWNVRLRLAIFNVRPRMTKKETATKDSARRRASAMTL
eukprot:3625314-Rhodomonas_salina.1